MDELKFTIKTNEMVRMPDPDKSSGGIFIILKRVVWGIVGLMVLASILLGENLFFEISWSARILLIGMVISSFTWGGKRLKHRRQ